MKPPKIRIAKGVLSDRIYAGRINKRGDAWIEKEDVTSDFLVAVIDRFGGFKEIIKHSDGKYYEIAVKKL